MNLDLPKFNSKALTLYNFTTLPIPTHKLAHHASPKKRGCTPYRIHRIYAPRPKPHPQLRPRPRPQHQQHPLVLLQLALQRPRQCQCCIYTLGRYEYPSRPAKRSHLWQPRRVRGRTTKAVSRRRELRCDRGAKSAGRAVGDSEAESEV